jgi:hypothetical protein
LEFAPGVQQEASPKPVDSELLKAPAPEPRRLEIGPADPTIASIRAQLSSPTAPRRRAAAGLTQAIVRGLVLGGMLLFCGIAGYFIFAQRSPVDEDQEAPPLVDKSTAKGREPEVTRPSTESEPKPIEFDKLPALSDPNASPIQPVSTASNTMASSRRSLVVPAKRAISARRAEPTEAAESRSIPVRTGFEDNAPQPQSSEQSSTSAKDSVNDPGF